MNGNDLDIFVGVWAMEARFPGAPAAADADGPLARSVFEWILQGRYLAQRTEISVPEAPDSLAIVARGPGEGSYTQHYYDSRGVTRLYAMTFRDGMWTLVRESPDFSALDFAQRYTGRFSPDGNRVDGAWEIRRAGTDWALDFELSYVRLT